MLDFNESEVKFKFKGRENKLRVPNNRDMREYRKSLSKCKTDEQREDLLFDLFVKLGAEKEVIDELTPIQTQKLLESLTGVEKN